MCDYPLDFIGSHTDNRIMIDPLTPLPIDTIAIYMRESDQPVAISSSLRRLLSGKPNQSGMNDIQYPVLMEGGTGDPVGYIHQSSISSLISLLGIDNLYAVTPDNQRIEGNMLWSL